MLGQDDVSHAISNGRKEAAKGDWRDDVKKGHKAAAKGDWKDDVKKAKAKAAGVKRGCKEFCRWSILRSDFADPRLFRAIGRFGGH